MKFKVISITSVLFMGLVWSCSWHNIEEDVLPPAPSPCDSLPATFADTILPIVRHYCSDLNGGPGCHRAGNGTVPEITNYTQVKGLVDAGRIQARVINRDPQPMPPAGAGALSICEVELLERWINDGALDN